MEKNFVIIDYGMGNLKSVVNAFRFLGCRAIISDGVGELMKADAIVLPGVGAFGQAMDNLKKLKLVAPLTEQVIAKNKPFLGICLGMQLIAEDSEEVGFHEGLGWIQGHVRKIRVEGSQSLPHIGWNTIDVIIREPFFNAIEGDFYFVHSYHLECDERFISARTKYGIDFASAVQKDNIFAVQFHPEKSQNNGLRLLRNFVNFVNSQR
jgi:imidazole glycerol-phosphate synthase subunit HisH